MRMWFRGARESNTAEDSAEASDAAGIPVLDAKGDAFEALRASRTELALYRVTDVEELRRSPIALLAAYSRAALETDLARMDRPTVVVGVGLGEHCASLALSLGALGYVHDTLDRATMVERLSLSLLRHSLRRRSFNQ